MRESIGAVKTFAAEALCLRRLACDTGTGFRGTAAEFFAVYDALQHVGAAVRDRSVYPSAEIINRIANLLFDRRFTHQRQVYFFYQSAAEALRIIMLSASDSGMAAQALQGLRRALANGEPAAQRAVMDIVGRLPVAVTAAEPRRMVPPEIPSIGWHTLVRRQDLDVRGSFRIYGRSLVTPVGGAKNTRLFVLKLARLTDRAEALVRETAWMEHLGRKRFGRDSNFRVPKVLRVAGAPVFRVTGLPCRPDGIHPDQLAVGFIADRAYFAYPNAPSQAARRTVKAVMLQNARLLGGLAAEGIIHAAPIPLFHNRIQADRRDDHGRYDWFRGGRLDRWLASCRYPNFGPTGLRDFEHFIALKGSNRRLFQYIGAHLLSLLLVGGSHFRNRDPDLIGFDQAGEPADARHLFDPVLFKEILWGIFAKYYEGFTGRSFQESLPFDLDSLVGRMIEEMGIDRHMQEVLRTADQNAMSETTFRDFLRRGGYSADQVRQMQRGGPDITVLSGPHLGEFNRGISLPEMTTAIGTMAALCMLARFRYPHDRARQSTAS
jgi:hypothetical protein